MSADRVSVCPRCMARAVAAHARESHALEHAYGAMTSEEFMKRTMANTPPSPARFRTFAEYYEIHGAESGTVTVDYGARCETCGLGLDFKHSHEIPGVMDP